MFWKLFIYGEKTKFVFFSLHLGANSESLYTLLFLERIWLEWAQLGTRNAPLVWKHFQLHFSLCPLPTTLFSYDLAHILCYEKWALGHQWRTQRLEFQVWHDAPLLITFEPLLYILFYPRLDPTHTSLS